MLFSVFQWRLTVVYLLTYLLIKNVLLHLLSYGLAETLYRAHSSCSKKVGCQKNLLKI